MKKLQKIVLIVLMISVTYLATYTSYAGGFGDIWQTGKNFLNRGDQDSNVLDHVNVTAAKQPVEEMVDFLWGIGLLVIFVTTIVLGIRYMLVLPNEKSRIKQATTPYILGVVIIFGSLTIWKFLIDILDGSLML